MHQTMTFEKSLPIGNTQIGYTFTPAIPGYGSRLYIERGFGITSDLVKGLNALSIWSGYDKEGDNFLAWEFRGITEELLVKFMREMLHR